VRYHASPISSPNGFLPDLNNHESGLVLGSGLGGLEVLFGKDFGKSNRSRFGRQIEGGLV